MVYIIANLSQTSYRRDDQTYETFVWKDEIQRIRNNVPKLK